RKEIEPAAAGLGRHVGGVEPLLEGALLDLLAELERHLAETLGLALVRNDFLLHELADGLHEHALLLGQRDIPGHDRRPPPKNGGGAYQNGRLCHAEPRGPAVLICRVRVRCLALTPLGVFGGLDPAIQSSTALTKPALTWIAGSSPAMTMWVKACQRM